MKFGNRGGLAIPVIDDDGHTYLFYFILYKFFYEPVAVLAISITGVSHRRPNFFLWPKPRALHKRTTE